MDDRDDFYLVESGDIYYSVTVNHCISLQQFLE